MNIPDEAVKAAAAALKRRLGNVLTGDDTEWEMDAYTVLTAAAPFIAAQAWDEGSWAAQSWKLPRERNPYRSGQ